MDSNATANNNNPNSTGMFNNLDLSENQQDETFNIQTHDDP